MRRFGLRTETLVSLSNNMKTQYFSKWRKEWIDFTNQPTGKGEILSMKKYKYKIRKV